MAKVRVKMNNGGVRAMLKSPGVNTLLMSHAEPIATRAGSGYAATLGTAGRTRNRAWVRTETFEAMRDNARNATLARALGGG